jgi:hypothetical protein
MSFMRRECVDIPVIGSTLTDTYLPIAVGTVLGAAVSLVFIVRSSAFSEKQPGRASASTQRQRRVRIILGVYVVFAFICLAIAVVIGDVAFIVLGGVIALLASIGLVRR